METIDRVNSSFFDMAMNWVSPIIDCKIAQSHHKGYIMKLHTSSMSRCLNALACFVFGALTLAQPAILASEEFFPVSIAVDANKSTGPWIPFWRFFGADEPNYAYMPQGERLLGELGKLGSALVFFRTHHLLTSGDGAHAPKFGSTSAYKEDSLGNPVYDWSINDRIFDTYLKQGVRPYVQIGFMPEALSTHPEEYLHNPDQRHPAPVKAGHSRPPKDYQRWGDLVHEWTKHCLERYGKEEVMKWYWQVWNEANAPTYWQGSREDFFKLYDYAVDGVRRALPEAKVGGPETAGDGGTWMRDFLEHCARGKNYATGKIGSPLDFISFHAKGQPIMVDGRVRMGMSEHLSTIRRLYQGIAGSDDYRHLPIIIGESDPDTSAAYIGPLSAYRHGTMFASYTAASFPRKLELATRYGVNLEGALTWSFTFEGKPIFAGYRQLASDGIDHAVFNVFRMFGQMGGQRLSVASTSALDVDEICKQGVRERPDVGGWASRDGDQVLVMLWHYHDLDVPGPAAQITLDMRGMKKSASFTRQVIDENHGNAYTTWLRLGSPTSLTTEQRAMLVQASGLADLGPAENMTSTDGRLTLSLSLPRQAVTLLRFNLRSGD